MMIKNRYNKFLSITALLVALTSCSLEPEIDNTYGEDFAFTNPERAEGFLMNAYANLPQMIVDPYGGNFLDAATDNAVTNDFNSSIYRLSQGGLTANTNPVGNWRNAYIQFRNIHIFLENGLGDQVNYDITDEETNQEKKRNLKGEAYFLRAWWGFQLLQAYGGKTADGQALGYSIILSTQSDEESKDLESVVRNTYAECVAQIKRDLDTAMVYLPVAYAGNDAVTGELQLGRADQQATMALRSRVALYAASPAYQPDDITTISSMGQFAIVDQSAFEAKWKIAAQDAQDAIDLIGNFSSLKQNDFTKSTTPNDFIWRGYHRNNAMEKRNYPISEFGEAITGPSQNLVDAFYGENGFPITDSRSNFDPENPYQNRDPRLYLNVLYNGQEVNNDPLQIYQGGEDSQSVYPRNTRTGYYLRKWMSLEPGLLSVENSTFDHHHNPYLRKTELYLNFAEAANEAYGPVAVGPGLSSSAIDVIKEIRTAAGITDNTYVDEVAAQGKEAFRKLILQERRLELAFENHRYFDLRRWFRPLNEPIYGIQITLEDDGSLRYSTTEVEARNFNEIKYYYAPLPYDELVKSPNLVNNLGW